MMRRAILPLLFGTIGCAILIALGSWQLQRLYWKSEVLAEIESRLSAVPVPLPREPDPSADRFLPVEVSGRLLPPPARVLTAVSGVGPAYRLISPFLTADGRRIMVDRGIVPQDAATEALDYTGSATVRGNLHWPDEVDGFTPEPDPAAGLWYARDVSAMAESLETEPILVVAREISGDPAIPQPIDTTGIPNNHLEYALTWFSLAAAWAGMTGLLLWRIRQRPE
ncbi:SURF1 family protein [Roseitranquillus sediminis]|uniref:SURF1 family protein n=1 Tax=Roseitranquillus sediminis TaxID=2809051 RepID=UPI001D0C28DA|nr:SURF1 family protein [Roseitranquillus sediminis]MBM9593744.1 SURF1 family protein [Roseitranquillus sediminis]